MGRTDELMDELMDEWIESFNERTERIIDKV